MEYVKSLSLYRRSPIRMSSYHRISRGTVKSSRQVEQELLYKKGVSKAVLEEALEGSEKPQDEREQIRTLDGEKALSIRRLQLRRRSRS